MTYHVIAAKSGRQVGTFKTLEAAQEYLKVIPFASHIETRAK